MFDSFSLRLRQIIDLLAVENDDILLNIVKYLLNIFVFIEYVQ